MYWNNPLIEILYPSDLDPITDSLHQGQHCIFFNPIQDIKQIRTNQTLQDLCNWANDSIKYNGIDGFLNDPLNEYDMVNLVKLNMWVNDLPKRGSIKPMLLQYTGNSLLESGTGESRLRALERIESMPCVAAFISTHIQYQDHFSHLESVTTFKRFAELCGATIGQQFLFRLTDDQALYGLDWYEYNSQHTESITPSHEECIRSIKNYITQNSKIVFTPEWFDTLVNWDDFKN
jgi:hypothetical protein